MWDSHFSHLQTCVQALSTTGVVVAWGLNNYGQAGSKDITRPRAMGTVLFSKASADMVRGTVPALSLPL